MNGKTWPDAIRALPASGEELSTHVPERSATLPSSDPWMGHRTLSAEDRQESESAVHE